MTMNVLEQRPLTLNHTNAGLVAGTTSTYTTTAATLCSIRGKFATALGAQTNTASPTTDANTGLGFVPLTANQTCTFVWGVNLAGAIQVIQGPAIPTAIGVTTTVGAFINAPQFPTPNNDFCPIGYQIVRVAPSGSFTLGTTAWAASGVSGTFRNIATLPDRPQLS